MIRSSGHLIRRPENCFGKAKLEASAHTSPITYMGRDRRQYVALVMAAGGGAFLGGGLSNTLVAFALPDVRLRPLPVSVSKAVAATAAAMRGAPKVGGFAPARCRQAEQGVSGRPAEAGVIRWKW
jgi:site-specific recombinase